MYIYTVCTLKGKMARSFLKGFSALPTEMLKLSFPVSLFHRESAIRRSVTWLVQGSLQVQYIPLSKCRFWLLKNTSVRLIRYLYSEIKHLLTLNRMIVLYSTVSKHSSEERRRPSLQLMILNLIKTCNLKHMLQSTHISIFK